MKSSPIKKPEILNFCRKYISLIDEIYHIENPGVELFEMKLYKEASRKGREKKKELYPIVKMSFNCKDIWGLTERILYYYHTNKDLVNNVFRLSQSDKKAIDDYSFQVPYNGTNEFYDKEKARHFEAGLIYARSNPLK